MPTPLPIPDFGDSSPNFFLAGAPRCGTSSLFAYLRQHPDVFLPEDKLKEPNFFMPQGFVNNHLLDTQGYVDMFAGQGDKRRRGEASVMYLYCPETPETLKALGDDVKILFNLRDPVDFVFSLYHMMHSLGYEDAPTLRDALALGPQRDRGEMIPQCTHWPLATRYRYVARFSPHIKRWLDVFGRDRVKIVLIDDLHQAPERVCQETFEFLDLDPSFKPVARQYNSTEVQRVKGFVRRHPSLQWLASRMSSDMRVRLASMLATATRQKTNRNDENADVREKLRVELDDEIVALQDIIGRDLSHWRSKAHA